MSYTSSIISIIRGDIELFGATIEDGTHRQYERSYLKAVAEDLGPALADYPSNKRQATRRSLTTLRSRPCRAT
jgi:hypothetical protein